MATKRTRDSKVVRAIRGNPLKLVCKTVWNLNGYTVASQIRDSDGDGDVVSAFTCTLEHITTPNGDVHSIIRLVLPQAETLKFATDRNDYACDLRLTSASGEISNTPKFWIDFTATAVTR